MNKYLLLRDNKQSGPYTCEELQVKGIKAYDLVWIEGKSAAWRYPSEVDELKPFSPVIEEQPFERFYKKTEEPQTEPTPRAQVIQLVQPVKTEPVAKKVEKPLQAIPPAPKKIYINFPAAAGIRNASPQHVSEDKPSNPVVPSPVVAIENATPKTFKGSSTTSWNTNEGLSNNHYPVAQKPNNRSALIVLAAGCILLIGVVIGLIYSNNVRLAKQRELENIVRQMKQAEQPASISISTEKQTPIDESANALKIDRTENTAALGIPVKNNFDKQISNAINVSKAKKPVRGVKESLNNPSRQVSAPETTVVSPVNSEVEKPNRNTLEQNRKNIFSKVTVESNKFKTGLLGGINNLQLTLFNHSAFQLDDVEVEVKYKSAENKLVKTQTVYFTNVSPGEQLSLKVPKSNRGVTVEYAVKKINTKELGVAQSDKNN